MQYNNSFLLSWKSAATETTSQKSEICQETFQNKITYNCQQRETAVWWKIELIVEFSAAYLHSVVCWKGVRGWLGFHSHGLYFLYVPNELSTTAVPPQGENQTAKLWVILLFESYLLIKGVWELV